MHELHHLHHTPLLTAVAELGTEAPHLTGRLIGGLVQAAMTAVEHGADPHDVADRTLALIHHGITPPGGSSA
ncbi:hypothetical protein [Streptomyces sp. NPDC020983]|uniref:hypothetical protein n=1 Tax=Streptomyces sp. NPDC020983 TaxID=3365106 RepID=UPI00379B2925